MLNSNMGSMEMQRSMARQRQSVRRMDIDRKKPDTHTRPDIHIPVGSTEILAVSTAHQHTLSHIHKWLNFVILIFHHFPFLPDPLAPLFCTHNSIKNKQSSMQRTSNNKYSSKNNAFVINPAYLNTTSSHASQNSTTEAAGTVGAVAAGPAAAGNNVVNTAKKQLIFAP